ncbi:DegT/DnrJ/EryC1/StrS family aminotransferase [Vibrio sp. HN007]|uniref:DegT/DnrJ/EryC1/StrS family aminotransferase n=1 Tax=Vibrio iocasae TaxID=3098914 RepID=UPI0035D4091B
MNFIDLEAQYKQLKTKIDSRINDVLSHGKYIMGPEVFELEEKLGEFTGVKHVITCANGTDALTLAMMALDIGPGDAVFCPTFTFFASAETIAFSGATPVFVDSDEFTFNICSVDLENRILSIIDEGKLNPKAIVSVDLFGLPANYDEITQIADKYDLKIIEDAAQGFGGAIKDKKAGSFGDIATTSFFPAKPLGCYGDGGAIFTNNDEYAELIRSYRVHGKGSNKYDNVRVGLNSRLDTIQAAILLEKLTAFPAELERRNAVAESYSSKLNKELLIPTVPNNYYSSWAQYTVRSTMRDIYIEKFKLEGVPVMVYYNKCMHEQTAFQHLGYKKGDFPVAETLSKQVLSLPISGYINEHDLALVIKASY